MALYDIHPEDFEDEVSETERGYRQPEEFEDEETYMDYLDITFEQEQDRQWEEYRADLEKAYNDHKRCVNMLIVKFVAYLGILASRARERTNAPGGTAAIAAIARNYDRAGGHP
jgi:hypothetical protein